MRFYDKNNDSVVTLEQLKREFLENSDEFDGITFPEHLCNVIEATIYERNDCELIDMTAREAWKLECRIMDRFVRESWSARM